MWHWDPRWVLLAQMELLQLGLLLPCRVELYACGSPQLGASAAERLPLEVPAVLRLNDDLGLLAICGRRRRWIALRALELPLVFAQPRVLELEGLELAKVLRALRATLHVGQAVDWLLLAARQGPSEATLPLYRRAAADILDCFLEYILANIFAHL